ncbi:class I SAM-dependent methyltransferase [Xanthobacteraceae bacterium Astr-EGSB]|uniref:class I SAM-dependent methyltransferase n=1 Tax=Astrobacterium formosum TaxID=3069710 RepID=UPI0027B6B364|nr:class I SAM-dependent methyltransferase [Xanthobacteraceae bacterium Astr-EGSB]
MSHASESPNFDYLLDRSLKWVAITNPRILDFGCGTGALVTKGIGRHVDIWGADTFEGFYEQWEVNIPEAARSRIKRIEAGVIPFADESFDVVIANQVFEHIREPLPVLQEIKRVLCPGGLFIALFPHAGVWFEGHVGLYFPHWMNGWPRLRSLYLRLGMRLGFGYYRHLGVEGWQHVLDDVTFYHELPDIRAWWANVFGQLPASEAADWMGFRIDRSHLPAIFSRLARHSALRSLLTRLCHIRAGLILRTTKS